MMSPNPSEKYRAFPAVPLSDRTWPNQVISKAPIWMSTDLRDGNQALIEPMSAEKKLRFFEMLVSIGIKEIEVAFPSASDTDFDFVRKLVVENRIPDDVTIEVLTQSREDLIRRTVDSVQGAKRAIIHLYNPVAPAFRRIVFGMSREEVKAIAVTGTRLIKQLTDARPETEWVFEYSPETFSMTELDFSKEICDAVSEIWQPTPDRKMIVNLPSTVECTTPNVYADQIEWMHRHLARREAIVLSVHPHNDRGTAVASAELAVMAGADRVEGCLFGNGERTGNVDLVTLALNLYTQGVHPGLDFSDIDTVRQCVEECNQLPVHPRHPYVGDLVFTAFSGSHQDAIKKGFAKQEKDAIWEVPYLPIDPADLGRNYDAVIRVNSQSGKGGMAFLLEQEYGLALPRRLQIEFSRAVQAAADQSGKEMTAQNIHTIFQQEYLDAQAPYAYQAHHILENRKSPSEQSQVQLHIDLLHHAQPQAIHGAGNGPIDAMVHAFQSIGQDIRVMDYHEHSIGAGANAQAACYIEIRVNNGPTRFGVGIDGNIVTASFKAVLSAVNRDYAAGLVELAA
ncbi:2-isopropylmalate synthase [Undibacterium sp.]|jgi:2-isopropylmalate synthase|uniref:2-isopropylmalate synthase n=1 Tax=Undibacterium sp. TaxID=1914977 RepID=UPI002BBE211A|nr:2-isopropylmalate synthase [Undibacterium sp.]HTD03077.1 2-isopropylmalate synthase [Undibacterium sp.]